MPQECLIVGCPKKVIARGMCNMHYTRWLRYGDPNFLSAWSLPGGVRIPIETRLLNKISPEPNSGCWLWLGAVTENGYGSIRFKKKITPAHRVSYTLFKGEIPAGFELDHLCRVRCCINPDHLEPVLHKVNVHRGKSAKLTENDVRFIRRAYSRGQSQTKLANRFRVVPSAISSIIRRKNWSDPTQQQIAEGPHE